MNNDTNNNLNGTVLGSVNEVSEPTPSVNVGVNVTPTQPSPAPQVVEPVNVNSGQVMSEPQVVVNPTPVEVTPAPQVVETPQVQSNVVMNEGVNPNPSYTNPADINPQPMPGFDNPGVIGQTPPVSLDVEKKPKKSNKLAFIVLILAAILAVGYGVYYVLTKTDLIKQNSAQVTITAKDINVNIGEVLPEDVNSFAEITGTDSKNCTLDVSNVDVNQLGNYEFTVTCGSTSKTGHIFVVDNSEVSLNLKNIYKTKGESVEPREFVVDPDDSYTYEFVDADSASTNKDNGEYEVVIKVTSSSGKTSEGSAKMTILQYALKGDIVCTSNSQNVAGATMVSSNKFTIHNDGNNGFAGIASEKYTFTYTDETEYNNAKSSSDGSGSITINNVSGNAEFDDDNKVITISNDLDTNSLNTKFGQENITNYGTIKNYFENTLKYTCVYERSE